MINGSKVASDMTQPVLAVPMLGTPSIFTVTRYSASSIKLSWSAVTGASGYTIYRYNATTKVYVALNSTTSLSYINTGLTKNTTYYYKVSTYHLEGSTKVYGGMTAVKSAKTY